VLLAARHVAGGSVFQPTAEQAVFPKEIVMCINNQPFDAATLQQKFAAMFPTIRRYTRYASGGLNHDRDEEDVLAEMKAMVWCWLVRLAARGKDGTRFPGTLAYLAARAVRSGRRIAGTERAKDVMSPLAQARHGFKVERLPHSIRRCHDDIYFGRGQRRLDVYEERLADA
jgi:hypothetical protein